MLATVLSHTLSKAGPSTSKTTAQSLVSLYSTVSGLARKKGSVQTSRPLDSENEVVHPARDYSDPNRVKRWLELPPTPPHVKAHKERMKALFPEGWAPPRTLSRQAMDGLRLMHAQNPDVFTTPVLAEKFRISPEAVRRILRSKWVPSTEKRQRLIEREKREREAWIAQRRMEERQKSLELQENEAARLRNKNDKLTLV